MTQNQIKKLEEKINKLEQRYSDAYEKLGAFSIECKLIEIKISQLESKIRLNKIINKNI